MRCGTSTQISRGRFFAHYNVGKDPNWYGVQVSDTTMMPNASLPGQQKASCIGEGDARMITIAS